MSVQDEIENIEALNEFDDNALLGEMASLLRRFLAQDPARNFCAKSLVSDVETLLRRIDSK